MVSFLFFFFLLLNWAESNADWIVNNPSTSWPVLSAPRQQADTELIVDYELKYVDGSSDGEMIDALEHFFWNLHDGIVLEMGALDGSRNTNSQSKIFEKFGWKRILIEANPSHCKALKLQGDAFSACTAICATEGMIHYSVNKKHNMTSGILEFMEPGFIKHYHRQVYDAGILDGSFDVKNIDWSSPALASSDVTVVNCIPLGTVLKTAGVTHVNFLILDVEGAELAILETLDWSTYRFDVLVVEKSHHRALQHFFQTVATDYVLVAERGRNMWLKHKEFVPSRRPKVDDLCYRGCVKAGIWQSKKIFCTTSSLPIP